MHFLHSAWTLLDVTDIMFWETLLFFFFFLWLSVVILWHYRQLKSKISLYLAFNFLSYALVEIFYNIRILYRIISNYQFTMESERWGSYGLAMIAIGTMCFFCFYSEIERVPKNHLKVVAGLSISAFFLCLIPYETLIGVSPEKYVFTYAISLYIYGRVAHKFQKISKEFPENKTISKSIVISCIIQVIFPLLNIMGAIFDNGIVLVLSQLVQLFSVALQYFAFHLFCEEDIRFITARYEEDLVKQKAIENEIRQAKTEVEQALRAKSEFLSNMSHELRTPLNSIIGFSQLLMDGKIGIISPEQREFLKDIYESGTHLLEMISHILDLSMIEKGKISLEIRECSIAQIIETCMVIIAKDLLNKKIKLDKFVNPQARTNLIRADETRLKQVILNLLLNSIKFTPEGGRMSISAEVGERGDLCVRVADSGIGISKKNLEKLFRPFSQLEDPFIKKYSGIGAGLYFAKQIVELHRGRIWIESKIGQGTTTSFTIPKQ